MDADRLAGILAGADALYDAAAGASSTKKRPAPTASPTPPTQQSSSKPSSSAPPASTPVTNNQPVESYTARKEGLSKIVINKRQKKNPLMEYLRMPGTYEPIVPDFVTGPTTCVLFLQLKYHRVRPEYILSRITSLGKDFELRILMLLIEEDDSGVDTSVQELTKLALYQNLTLYVVWNYEDAARVLRYLKLQDTAQPRAIMGQVKTAYEDQLNDTITGVRELTKNNAATLVSTYGSLRNAVIHCEDNNNALEDIIGWGPVRARAFKDAINAPFIGT